MSSEVGLSEASDVWQLGISLFALGCGKMPFQTEEEICYGRNLPWHLYSGIPISDAYKSFISSILQNAVADRATIKELKSSKWLSS